MSMEVMFLTPVSEFGANLIHSVQYPWILALKTEYIKRMSNSNHIDMVKQKFTSLVHITLLTYGVACALFQICTSRQMASKWFSFWNVETKLVFSHKSVIEDSLSLIYCSETEIFSLVNSEGSWCSSHCPLLLSAALWPRSSGDISSSTVNTLQLTSQSAEANIWTAWPFGHPHHRTSPHHITPHKQAFTLGILKVRDGPLLYEPEPCLYIHAPWYLYGTSWYESYGTVQKYTVG